MKQNRLGRRAVMRRTLTVLGASALAPTLLAACGGDDDALSCQDTSGLTAPQIATRQGQSYTDSATNAAETCNTCNFFTAGQEGCGSCSVIQGPIHPDGYCNLWVVRS